MPEKHFGEALTPSQLISEFHGRKRRKGESLRDYSYALMELMDRVLPADPTAIANKAEVLRDRFINGVKDHRLHVALCDKAETQADLSFKDLWDYAFEYEGPTATKQPV